MNTATIQPNYLILPLRQFDAGMSLEEIGTLVLLYGMASTGKVDLDAFEKDLDARGGYDPHSLAHDAAIRLTQLGKKTGAFSLTIKQSKKVWDTTPAKIAESFGFPADSSEITKCQVWCKEKNVVYKPTILARWFERLQPSLPMTAVLKDRPQVVVKPGQCPNHECVGCLERYVLAGEERHRPCAKLFVCSIDPQV